MATVNPPLGTSGSPQFPTLSPLRAQAPSDPRGLLSGFKSLLKKTFEHPDYGSPFGCDLPKYFGGCLCLIEGNRDEFSHMINNVKFSCY